MPSYTKDIVDATLATMDMIAPYHMQSEIYHSMAPVITLVEAHALVQNHTSVIHVDYIPI